MVTLFSIEVLSEHLKRLLKLRKLTFHLILLHLLVRRNFLMLSLLLSKILQKFSVLMLRSVEAVVGIVSELLDKLEPLDGLRFDLAVVALHRLEIAAKGVELRIKEAFQELHVLSLVRILIEQSCNILDWRKSSQRGRDWLPADIHGLSWRRLSNFRSS